jgi:hypothetical protein
MVQPHQRDGDPWLTVDGRWATGERLHADGLVSEVPCTACGYPTLSAHGRAHVCVVCHWKDDGSTRDQPDRPSEVNHGLTLREAAANVAQTGVSASPWDAMTRPEFFLPAVRAARDALMVAYDRLLADPLDAGARADVHSGRASVMRAIVNEMR